MNKKKRIRRRKFPRRLHQKGIEEQASYQGYRRSEERRQSNRSLQERRRKDDRDIYYRDCNEETSGAKGEVANALVRTEKA
jgi:hypothetical protein